MNSTIKLPIYVNASLIFLGLGAFIGMLYIAQEIIIPIIYSAIIAVILNPFVKFFVNKGINRVFAITITLTSLIILTVLFVLLLSSQIVQFADTLPKLIDNFQILLDQLVAWIADTFGVSVRKINLWINGKNKEILAQTTTIIGQTIINTGSVLIILVLMPVYIFMILYYQPLFLEFIHKLFNTTKHKQVNDILTATKKIIQSYLVGLLFEALIVAFLNSTSLLIIGIDYAILLGVIGAILNIIPYIGGVIAVALPMLIAFATKTPSTALIVLVAYIVIQFIDNNFIIAKVVASKVQINAFMSVLVVIIGGAIWGVPGMFLSIPLTAILKVIFDHIDSLKPVGFLLGDNMPIFSKNKLLKNIRLKKK